MSSSSLRQRRASEGGFPRLSEDDGGSARARRKSYTGATPGPNLATPRAPGARMSAPRTPRASVSGLRPIADCYELTDDKLPAAQQASTELLRCRVQAVLAAQILMQDLVRSRAGYRKQRRGAGCGTLRCVVAARRSLATTPRPETRRSAVRPVATAVGLYAPRAPRHVAHTHVAPPQVPGIYIACFATRSTPTGVRSTQLQQRAAHTARTHVGTRRRSLTCARVSAQAYARLWWLRFWRPSRFMHAGSSHGSQPPPPWALPKGQLAALLPLPPFGACCCASMLRRWL